MSTSVRNLAVGLFVLIALALLGWMIVSFGTQPRLLGRTYTLTMTFPSAGNVVAGSEVKVGGLTVGHVRSIEPVRDFLDGVRIVADIDRDHSIPADSQAIIAAGGVGLAKPFISIEVSPKAQADFLPKDGSASLAGMIRTEGLIPPEIQQRFDQLTHSLTLVANDMHQLLVPLNEFGQPISQTQPEANISIAIRHMNQVLERINAMLDPENGQVTRTIAGFEKFASQATDAATAAERGFKLATTQVEQVGQTATAQLRHIGDAMLANSVQLSQTLNSVNRMLTDVREGRGTLGRLITDPALFENMVLATDRLHQAIIQLERLIQEWERDGMKLKLR